MQIPINQSTSLCCLICLQQKQQQQSTTLPTCHHIFCNSCLHQYINTLKKYNLLNPDKLRCLNEDCSQEIPDGVIQKLYPGEEGFVLTVVRKRYKQSKDPSVRIFNCKGYTKMNRQPLVDKPSAMGRDVHSKLMNEKMRSILDGHHEEVIDRKICTNIMSFNPLSTKDKLLQCYVCGVSYCCQCLNFYHDGKCQQKKQLKQQQELKKYEKKKNQSQNPKDPNSGIEAYLRANAMAKCLNPKCGLPIAKQQGCFWVKCRCSWQFCYPCQKLWGDCQHFSKYPYKKFVPPPEWMVKALKLY